MCECADEDPDCQDPYIARYPAGCDDLEWCVNNQCTRVIPPEWNTTLTNCEDFFYNDTLYCNCGCGAQDPDCISGNLPILGCFGQEEPTCVMGLCQENEGTNTIHRSINNLIIISISDLFDEYTFVFIN